MSVPSRGGTQALARAIRLAAFGLSFAAGLWGLARAATMPHAVVVVPISGTVDEGMAHLVERSVDGANAEGAAAVVLDVNTLGGLVTSAMEIRDALFRSHAPTIAYISQRAYSAGALISLSTRHVIMAPGSSIGAAEPIPNTIKNISALRAEFASTAARNHHDPTLAAAMVDKTVEAPAYKKPGAILSLTADQALRAHVADRIAPTLDAALQPEGIAALPRQTEDYTFGEQLARFATSPEMSGLLLSIGMLGLLIEMQTLHGIAGLVGILALGLFFGTHVYAGFSNGFVIGLALLGILGILFELHVVPGHGVPGVLGGLVLLAAVVLSFGVAFFFVAVQALSVAIVLSALAFWGATRIFPENALVKRLAFSSAQGPDYVAAPDNRGLLGHSGFATSYLRPAGVASIDGRRVDVLTEGDFLPAGSPILVSRVEGARIFVRPLE
jgi:membrane-bound serine protease (ClpP class)